MLVIKYEILISIAICFVSQKNAKAVKSEKSHYVPIIIRQCFKDLNIPKPKNLVSKHYENDTFNCQVHHKQTEETIPKSGKQT